VVALGHPESLSLRDIQTNIEMDSHEEKLAIMIRQVGRGGRRGRGGGVEVRYLAYLTG
jgi:hypothetical protein